MWDPLYFGQIVTRRWLYLGLHALAVYVVMLVALPLLLQLTTTQTLALAAGAIGLLAAPSLGEAPDRQGRPKGLWLFAGALGLAAAAWIGRSFVPPATLWLGDATITTVVDTEHKVPGMDMRRVAPALAVERGVYAYTAIVAPRGLRERVFHQWFQGGKLIVSVPLEITGGREDGYRAWTHKTGFSGAAERWKVRVITESGQLLGELRFQIGGASAEQPAQQAPLPQGREPAGDQKADEAADHEIPVPADVPAPDQQDPARHADQDPDRQQVDPRPAAGAQLPDEERAQRDASHEDDPPPAAAPVPDGALEPEQLDDAQSERQDSK
jgi:hypothetical protein